MPPTPQNDAVLELRDAAVRLGERTLWSGVNLTVRAGEFTALLGPNGAGKSTMVKAILGLLPASGDIRVLGAPAGTGGRGVGYLPQRRTFDPSLRLRGVDIVRLGLDGHRWGVPTPMRVGPRRWITDARIAHVIDLVGAARYAHRPIGELSGGEQQRLLIAQALVRQPALLLLDEPLDSLDLPNQHAIAALVGRICREERVSTVMVAHDVNPILPYLDHVVYLAGGHAAAGPPDDVITSDTLSRLYGTPIDVLRTSSGRLVVVGSPDAPALHTDRHTEPTGSADATR